MANDFKKGYTRGYSDGRKVGYVEGVNDTLETDLEIMYSMVCLKLFDWGFGEADISEFITDVQKGWIERWDEIEENKKNGTPIEPLREKVLRITGFDIKQKKREDEK